MWQCATDHRTSVSAGIRAATAQKLDISCRSTSCMRLSSNALLLYNNLLSVPFGTSALHCALLACLFCSYTTQEAYQRAVASQPTEHRHPKWAIIQPQPGVSLPVKVTCFIRSNHYQNKLQIGIRTAVHHPAVSTFQPITLNATEIGTLPQTDLRVCLRS